MTTDPRVPEISPRMTAEEFINWQEEDWNRPLERRIEDISGEGYHILESQHVSCVVQSDLPEKVFMIERLEAIRQEGRIWFDQ